MSIEINSLPNCNVIREVHNVFTPHDEKTLFVKQLFLYIRRNVEDSHGTESCRLLSFSAKTCASIVVFV